MGLLCLYLVLFHSIGGSLVVFRFVLIVVFATCFILLQFLVELVVLVCCVSDLLYVVLLHFVICLGGGGCLFVVASLVLLPFLFFCFCFFRSSFLLLFWELGLRLLFVTSL